jgi:hypothetical protein
MSAKKEVIIKREATDPLCMRASIGGTPELGYYLTWRADDPLAVLEMLRVTLHAAEKAFTLYKRPQG